MKNSSSHPPPFQPNLIVQRKFRFESSAALTSSPVTINDLFDLVCMAATTTSAYGVYNSVRLRSVEIWGPMASDLKPVTVSVEFLSLNLGTPRTLFSDTSMGSSICAHVRAKPPVKGASAMWLLKGGTSIFNLTLPANSIVEVALDLVLQDGSGAQAVSAAVAGATVGVLYVRSLNAINGNNLVPLSFPTI